MDSAPRDPGMPSGTPRAVNAGAAPAGASKPANASNPARVPAAAQDLNLDLEIERIDTEGVMKEGFTGQER